jgi:hypothetical protein
MEENLRENHTVLATWAGPETIGPCAEHRIPPAVSKE